MIPQIVDRFSQRPGKLGKPTFVLTMAAGVAGCKLKE